MPPRIGRTLGGFLHRMDRRLYKIQPRRYMAVRWVYPPLDKAMMAVELEEVDTYVPVYFHSADTGDMYGGRETARSAGDNDMVGSCRPQLREGGDGYGDGGGGGRGGLTVGQRG